MSPTPPDPAGPSGLAEQLTAERISLEARTAMEAWRQALAKAGLSRAACLEALRSAHGQAAVDEVGHDVALTVQSIDDRVRRDVMHRPGSAAPRTRRHLLRAGI